MTRYSRYCADCHRWVEPGHKKQPGFEKHRAYALGRRKSRIPARYHILQFLRQLKAVPTSYDLRVSGTGGGIGIGPILNQEDESACVAFATTSVKMWKVGAETGSFPDLSPQFIYDVGRNANNSCPDPGMDSLWGVQVLVSNGVCPSADYPFTDSDNCGNPTNQAVQDAAEYKAENFAAITSVADMKQAILTYGAIQIGIPVYEEIMTVGPDGIIPMPGEDEQPVGGHELAVVGWAVINGTRYLTIKNSWGASWGEQGCGYLPEDYMTMMFQNGEADSYSTVDQPTPPTPAPTDCWGTFLSAIQTAVENNDLLGVITALQQLVACLQSQPTPSGREGSSLACWATFVADVLGAAAQFRECYEAGSKRKSKGYGHV
jgi:hypothetical protein